MPRRAGARARGPTDRRPRRSRGDGANDRDGDYGAERGTGDAADRAADRTTHHRTHGRHRSPGTDRSDGSADPGAGQRRSAHPVRPPCRDTDRVQRGRDLRFSVRRDVVDAVGHVRREPLRARGLPLPDPDRVLRRLDRRHRRNRLGQMQFFDPHRLHRSLPRRRRTRRGLVPDLRRLHVIHRRRSRLLWQLLLHRRFRRRRRWRWRRGRCRAGLGGDGHAGLIGDHCRGIGQRRSIAGAGHNHHRHRAHQQQTRTTPHARTAPPNRIGTVPGHVMTCRVAVRCTGFGHDK